MDSFLSCVNSMSEHNVFSAMLHPRVGDTLCLLESVLYHLIRVGAVRDTPGLTPPPASLPVQG